MEIGQKLRRYGQNNAEKKFHINISIKSKHGINIILFVLVSLFNTNATIIDATLIDGTMKSFSQTELYAFYRVLSEGNNTTL